jgi:hypothetical protein
MSEQGSGGDRSSHYAEIGDAERLACNRWLISTAIASAIAVPRTAARKQMDDVAILQG